MDVVVTLSVTVVMVVVCGCSGDIQVLRWLYVDVVVTLSVTVVVCGCSGDIKCYVVVALSVTVVVSGCSGGIKCYGGCMWM